MNHSSINYKTKLYNSKNSSKTIKLKLNHCKKNDKFIKLTNWIKVHVEYQECQEITVEETCQPIIEKDDTVILKI